MNNLNCFLVRVLILYVFIGAIIDGSSSSGITGPSPPRNVRRSVLSIIGADRKYHVYWTASLETGGSAVNYSVKLCINDSIDEDNHSCRWSSNSQCQPRNIVSSNKEFSCVLKKTDMFSSTGEFCNYIICVVASNEAGNAASCIFAPWIERGLATPQPPTGFSVLPESNGDVRVQWEVYSGLSYLSTVITVIYHAENKPNKLEILPNSTRCHWLLRGHMTSKNETVSCQNFIDTMTGANCAQWYRLMQTYLPRCINKETKEMTKKIKFTILRELEAFTKYCFYLMMQTLSREGNRSAPSDVLGPECVLTSAADPINPPVVQLAQSVRFPEDKSLRNVTVEWKSSKSSSWRGIPGQYRLLSHKHLSNEKRTYKISASSNRTVLQRLNSADSYIVYMQLCNREGKCSLRGSQYVIKPMQGNSTQPGEQTGLTSTQIGSIVGVVMIFVVVAAVLLVCMARKCLRKKPARERLSIILQLDDPPGLHEYNVTDQVENKYSSLYACALKDTKDEDIEKGKLISRDS